MQEAREDANVVDDLKRVGALDLRGQTLLILRTHIVVCPSY